MLGNSVYFLADRGRKDALAMTTKNTASCKNRFVFQVPQFELRDCVDLFVRYVYWSYS